MSGEDHFYILFKLSLIQHLNSIVCVPHLIFSYLYFFPFWFSKLRDFLFVYFSFCLFVCLSSVTIRRPDWLVEGSR